MPDTQVERIPSIPSQEQLRSAILDYAGLNREAMQKAAHTLLLALEAMDTKFFQFQGNVNDQRDVIAWKTRVDAAAKLLQLFDVRVTPQKPTAPPPPKGRIIDAEWIPTN